MAIMEEAIRRRVCSHCIDCGEDGRCNSYDPKGCAIYRFLPELVQVALSVKSAKMEDYEKALRQCICKNCRPGGETNCPLRQDLDCALNRYLPLVLDAIEEERAA